MTRLELLPSDVLAGIPPLYANESTPLDEAVIKVKYFIGGFTWLVTECEVQGDDVMFFGYVVNEVAPDCSEWGYFTLGQLMEVKLYGVLGVERDLYFTPCKFSEYSG